MNNIAEQRKKLGISQAVLASTIARQSFKLGVLMFNS